MMVFVSFMIYFTIRKPFLDFQKIKTSDLLEKERKMD